MEALAQPDDEESSLRKELSADETNLETYFKLANHLISKNRSEEAIPLLLDIITIERNWNGGAAKT